MKDVAPKPVPSRRKAVIGTFVSTGLNTLILSLQALLLMPICQKMIGGRVYGAWLASGDFLYWMMAFDLGLPNLMIQRIGAAQGKGDGESVGGYFATGVVLLCGVGVLLAIVALLVAPLFPTALGLHGQEAVLLTGCIRLAAVATGVVLATNSVLGYTRGVQDTAVFNAASLAGTTAMFLVSIGSLLSGSGLWSIPFGLVARALFAVIGSVWVVTARLKRGDLIGFRPSKGVATEYLKILPATALGGISYALMSQSESILVGVLLGPEKVPILNFTRRGAEVLRALIDTVAFASFGAFSHLIGSEDRARALLVHAQITTFRLSLAVGAAAVYIALNQSFVSTWAGDSLYGGPLLTILIGGQIIAAGASNLMNYLYRGTGQLMKGALAQFGESLVRIPLLVIGVLAFGYAGIPAAAILTSVVACYVLLKWTRQELEGFATPAKILTPTYVAVLALVFFAGVAGAYTLHVRGWSILLPLGVCLSAASMAVVLVADPYPIWKRKRGVPS